MINPNEQSHNSSPVGWFGYAIVPVVPFMLGAGIMQLSAPWQLGGVPADGLTSGRMNLDVLRHLNVSTIDASVAAFSHLGDQLTYAAAAFLQMMTCAVVIVFQLQHLRELKGAIRRDTCRILVGTMLLTLGVLALIHVTMAAPYQLSYLMIRQLLLLSAGWPEQFAADGPGGILFSQSRLFYASLVPFTLGAIAVALMTASVAAIATADGDPKKEWETEFAKRVAQLQNFFRMSSVVLVASAVALMLFVQLPIGLMDEASATAIAKFAQGLTVYWGSVMTLTLVAVFLLPVISLHREARAYYSKTETDKSFTEWLNDRGQLSVKRHLANLATMLAPVLVGPIGALMQSLFGG